MRTPHFYSYHALSPRTWLAPVCSFTFHNPFSTCSLGYLCYQYLQSLEGGWYSLLAWISKLSLLPGYILYHLHYSMPRTTFRTDVRFWYPTSFDLSVPGWTYTTSPHYHSPNKTRPQGRFGHHQYGIRIRLQPRSFSLQFGFDLRLPKGWRYRSFRKLCIKYYVAPFGPSYLNRRLPKKKKSTTKLQSFLDKFVHWHRDLGDNVQYRVTYANPTTHFDLALYDRYIHRPKAVEEEVHTHFDRDLYDRLLVIPPDPTLTSHFDSAHFDAYAELHRPDTRPAVMPICTTYFDSKLYDKYQVDLKAFHPNTDLDESDIKTEKQYTIQFKSKAARQIALEQIFSDLDPLTWYLKMKGLTNNCMIDGTTALQAKEEAKQTGLSLARKIERKFRQLKYRLGAKKTLRMYPMFISRTGRPTIDDMQYAALTDVRFHPKVDSDEFMCKSARNKSKPPPNLRQPVIIDTGASISCSPSKDDFVGEIKDVSKDTILNSLTDTIEIAGIGTVEWVIRDPSGNLALIRTTAYYIKEAEVRLFSPQCYFREQYAQRQIDLSCTFDRRSLDLHLGDDQMLRFPYSDGGQVPYMLTDDRATEPVVDRDTGIALFASQEEEIQSLLKVDNHNLKPDAQELTLWHQRLSHAGFQWVQDLMRDRKEEVGDEKLPPLVPTRLSQAKSCTPPKCAACILAKQHRRPTGSTKHTNVPDREMAIRRNDLKPGQMISTDQYVCTFPGRLPHTRGKEKASQQYHGGTIFYDHASSLIYCSHQVTLGAGDTVQSKHAFEQFAAASGVSIKGYRADNHPFSSAEFMEDINVNDQHINFSGVGAHHQNGASERALATIGRWAKSMMMHQLLHWPDEYDEANWPFAVDQACWIWNNMPKTRWSPTPLEVFTKMKQPTSDLLQRARVWGCPASVLDPRLQDKQKIPKWTKRSRSGMYVGSSMYHHSTVGRILNLKTGAVSAQFHVLYDELFTTAYGRLDDRAFDAKHWQDLLNFNSGDYFESGVTQESHIDDPSSPEKQAAQEHIARQLFEEFKDSDHVRQPLPTSTTVSEGGDPISRSPTDDTNCVDDETSVSEGGDPSSQRDQASSQRDQTSSNRDDATSDQSTAPPVTSPPKKKVKFIDELAKKKEQRANQRAARRTRNTNPKYAGVTQYQQSPICPDLKGKARAYALQNLCGGNGTRKSADSLRENARIHGLDWNPKTLLASVPNGAAKTTMKELLLRTPLGDHHPMALKAKMKGKDPDLPTYHEAMNGPDAEGYKEATRIEIETLKRMKVWDVVNRESWMDVLPSTWAFRRKTYPNGQTKKLKARFCVRGDKERAHVHYDPAQIFAPVVSWTTVRLMLLLTAQLELHSAQVDYVAAFVHAPIPLPDNYEELDDMGKKKARLYVEMPRGYQEEGKVLRLNKALYGSKNAPSCFFKFLKANLEAIDFVQAHEVDQCLFISEKVICLTYVDDTLLFAKEEKDIEEVIRKLKVQRHMDLEIEDDVAGFLGVDITKNPDTGEIYLKQIGLMKKIVEALKLDGVPAAPTPATETIGKDEDGDPPHCDFNYASVVGMAFYLYSHSMPEIGFAISQLARFTFAPKRSHELALIRLGQYIKGLLEDPDYKGMITKPLQTDKFEMDIYCDTDFCGLFGKEKRNDPDNVRSRLGYCITWNGCPLIWKSCLIGSICLSTMMAEYYGLSTAMKEVLPLRRLVVTIGKALDLPGMCESTFKCTAHEDNSAAEILANLPVGRVTPRSKFFDVKFHWFRQLLRIYAKEMSVIRIDTKSQLGDAWTKPLPPEDFTRLRKLISGY